MPTSQRRIDAGLIGQLLEHPQRFEFFQAVRLVRQWRPDDARFRNRLAMSFPPNQIENLSADESGVRITPAFIGLLGSQGALPLHYSERIARHERDHNDGGPRAFMDMLSHRAVEMFYEAWQRHRPECIEDEFLDMLNALAGTHVSDEMIDRETLAFYAMQIRSRTVSAPQLAGMYSEYFGVPVEVQQLVGEWSEMPAEDQAQLGKANVDLDGGIMLGARTYNCDQRARLRIGPLDKDRYQRFLPGHTSALHLQAMLELHCGVGMTWEIHLVQRAQDMRGVSLNGTSRLGVDARLLSEPAMRDCAELMYLLHT
ncbi:type VI secretion system baseplate subunit TssG [Duganella sp. FT80W]|uniref:Type VI secretion system baseplate subunit TssG n=1 Tax=Duganella guangzhouensis TaxID=2666084 RepID=A0A6I2LDN5_9BURK|nr:type VI secretion system baseplate subunit TssG [Duganella guangzhouensis]MRW94359.1 type VI secretion system baseplate subunit TssG [Duganella guangzhouensis]